MVDYSAIISHVAERIATVMDCSVYAGILPPGDGLAVSLLNGKVNRFLGGDNVARVQVAINAKSGNNIEALDAISAATDALYDFKFDGGAFQIVGVHSFSGVAYIGQDASGKHVYTSNCIIDAYFRRSV